MIKHCPKCGSKDTQLSIREKGRLFESFVFCSKCGATTIKFYSTNIENARNLAVNYWNNRMEVK